MVDPTGTGPDVVLIKLSDGMAVVTDVVPEEIPSVEGVVLVERLSPLDD